MRLVTHLDISREDVAKVVAAFKTFFKNWQA
jgi:threonine aldolase